MNINWYMMNSEKGKCIKKKCKKLCGSYNRVDILQTPPQKLEKRAVLGSAIGNYDVIYTSARHNTNSPCIWLIGSGYHWKKVFFLSFSFCEFYIGLNRFGPKSTGPTPNCPKLIGFGQFWDSLVRLSTQKTPKPRALVWPTIFGAPSVELHRTKGPQVIFFFW